jgi:hypothetical protein
MISGLGVRGLGSGSRDAPASPCKDSFDRLQEIREEDPKPKEGNDEPERNQAQPSILKKSGCMSGTSYAGDEREDGREGGREGTPDGAIDVARAGDETVPIFHRVFQLCAR